MPSWPRVRAVLLGLAPIDVIATMSEQQVLELLAAWERAYMAPEHRAADER